MVEKLNRKYISIMATKMIVPHLVVETKIGTRKKRQRNDFVGPSKNVPIETQDKIGDGKAYVERLIIK
jgi:hypothetical protein